MNLFLTRLTALFAAPRSKRRHERGALSVEWAIIVVGVAVIALGLLAAISLAVDIKIGSLEL